jgi:hypothetical protein
MLASRRLALLCAMILPAIGSAQTVPGLSFKIRTQLKNHPVPEKSKPDSVRIRRLAAAAEARANADISVGDAPPAARAAQQATQGGCQRQPGGANNVLMMDGAFTKGFGRMDVKGVIGCPELTATQVAVFTDTSSMIMDESEKVWWNRVFNIGSILDFTSAIDAQNPRQPVASLKVSWDSLPSEMYEGRMAKHYRLHMSYGLGQPTREDSLKLLAITDVISDYWVEDLGVNFENRFAGIGRPRRQLPDSLRAEWDKMLGLYAQLMKGTIVKFSATGIIGENANSATEYTRTMEMTEIKSVPLAPESLKIPADYTLRQPQRGRGGS